MAKCQCGREMLKANGCRFKRIVVHGKSTKTYNRIKVGDPGDWYEEYVGTPEEKNIRCGDCGAKIGFYTLRDCLHSGNECLKNKVLEYIYDTIVNMFNCTFENTNDGITGTDGLYAVSETFDKSLCNILGEDVPDSILQIALDMQTDNLTAVENKLEKMQVLGKTVNQKLISSLARTLEENNNGYLIAEAAFIISGGVTADCYSAFLAPNSYKLRAWPNQKQMKDIINHPEKYAVFSIQFSY